MKFSTSLSSMGRFDGRAISVNGFFVALTGRAMAADDGVIGAIENA
jgi:hypothetical protein